MTFSPRERASVFGHKGSNSQTSSLDTVKDVRTPRCIQEEGLALGPGSAAAQTDGESQGDCTCDQNSNGLGTTGAAPEGLLISCGPQGYDSMLPRTRGRLELDRTLDGPKSSCQDFDLAQSPLATNEQVKTRDITPIWGGSESPCKAEPQTQIS